jgi:uncharacterized peroxidase-related enzyme
MSENDVRLPVINEQRATGEVARLYDEIREHFGLGFVPDVFQLTSSRLDFARVFWDGYRSMFVAGTLDRETKELIAAVVARDAGCRYCVDAHLLLLELIGSKANTVTSARGDAVDDMPLPPRVRALLHFVQRIDHEAYKITDTDFDKLRDSGWTDDQLLEAIWTASLFNGIVRLVDTLGLYRLGQLAQPPPSPAAHTQG